MKLSELIQYRNQLDAMSNIPIWTTANAELTKITHLVESHTLQIKNITNELIDRQNNIQQSFDNFNNTLTLLKEEVKKLITEEEKTWFYESYRLYEKEMINETVDYILNRTVAITDETKEFYQTRIIKYTNWKYPAMIIRPGREPFIQSMVSCDPLYLVDEDYDLLTPSMKMYNELYQSRLRPYVINERQDGPILEKLPNGQFGLVFAYNFFNFRPFEVLRSYLEELYQKLRNGGVLIITFNDCDNDHGVRLVENSFCCYTPGYLVYDLAKSIGFDILFKWNDGGPTTWLELQKPGELKTLKGGQSLAKVLTN